MNVLAALGARSGHKNVAGVGFELETTLRATDVNLLTFGHGRCSSRIGFPEVCRWDYRSIIGQQKPAGKKSPGSAVLRGFELSSASRMCGQAQKENQRREPF